MSEPKRKIRLGAFVQGAGHHLAAWRHPRSVPDAGFNLEHIKQQALTAERGLFDAFFLADYLAVPSTNPAMLAYSGALGVLEPLQLLSVLSTVTTHIGLAATVSTAFLEPFHLARKFATLDILSNGRAAWNLVTSATPFEAANFGSAPLPPHAERYERATEYIDVVRGLWDNFEDDAFLFDRETPLSFRPDALHIHPHKGKHFHVHGPLHLPRPPQGYPVLVQAGSSEDGKAFASSHAEVIFTAQQSLEDAQAFYRDVRSRVAAQGRAQEDVLIMPGISAVIGDSEALARERYEELQSLIHPAVGVGLLSVFLAFDLSAYPVDGPLPEIPPTEGWQSRQKLLVDAARRGNLSIRQLYQHVAGARGHFTTFGTAAQIADQLEAWFHNEAADGFNIMPSLFPEDLNRFVDQVIPELQRRGLFRTAYEGRTLRENLGLKRPPNPHAKPRNHTPSAAQTPTHSL